MATQELLNIFWNKSGLSAVGDAFSSAVKFAMGTAEEMSAAQKTTVGKMWSFLSNLPPDVDKLLVDALLNGLSGFGVPDEAVKRIVLTIHKARPRVPLLDTAYMFSAVIIIFFDMLKKGLGSAGELLDKEFRRTLLPNTGSVNDWLIAAWRGAEPELIAKLGPELGFNGDWHNLINLANQWWPDARTAQEARRRGMVTDEIFHDTLRTIGVEPVLWHEWLEDLTWNPPDIATVLEMYRRSGFDRNKVAPQLRASGFDGETADFMLDSAARLIEFPNLLELRRRSIVDDKGLAERLGKLGFIERDAANVGELWKTLPDGFQLTQAYFREVINKREYLEGLEQLGFESTTANVLEQIAWQLPGPADLMRFGVREVFTPAIAQRFGQYQQYPEAMTEWANKIGMKREVALMYWAAHWDLPAIGQMFDMFHRGIISRADLKMGVRARDVMPFWQDKVIDLSYRLIPRRTLPRLIRQGLIEGAEATKRFRRLGFDLEDSQIMARSAALDATKEERDLTKTDIINAVKYDWFTVQQARRALQDLEYSKAAINYYISDAERRRDLESAKAAAEATIADSVVALDLSKAEVLRAYSAGMVDRPAAAELLASLGLTPETVTFKLEFADLQRDMSYKKHAAVQYKRLFEKHLRERTQIENALLNGAIFFKSYIFHLTVLFSPVDASPSCLPSGFFSASFSWASFAAFSAASFSWASFAAFSAASFFLSATNFFQHLFVQKCWPFL